MAKTFTFAFILSLFIFSCTQKPTELEVNHYLSEETAQLNLPFSEAVRVGDMLYLSGQVGNKPGTLDLVEGGIEAEAKQIMENIKTVLEANGSSFDHAVKFTVFIDDIAQWSNFNKVYVEYFPNKKPARSALGADGLALGAAVEVECIAYIPSKK
tara:strand:- start:418 stop:882 length:465 start_codon:yes stop_codon:yes gene_type:complete